MPHKKQSIKRVQEEARRQLSRAYSFSSPSLGLDLLLLLLDHRSSLLSDRIFAGRRAALPVWLF
jgi:hypothetical protein